MRKRHKIKVGAAAQLDDISLSIRKTMLLSKWQYFNTPWRGPTTARCDAAGARTHCEKVPAGVRRICEMMSFEKLLSDALLF
jgi:hypothetical protein